MEPILFFDCGCAVGTSFYKNYGGSWETAELLRKMRLYGIDKALVYHIAGKEYDPAVGNGLLADEIKDYPALYPVWVVMHHHTDEFDEPDALIKTLKEKNIKAVRMYPAAHQYKTSAWNCRELFTALAANKIPLFIDLDQLAWDEIHQLLTDYPELNLILTGLNYIVDRNIYALFKKFTNLYIETIGYKVNNGIEEICGRFGAGRLIFGSGMPVFSGSAAVSMIRYARIGENEKRMIARGNLESLLEGVSYGH